MLKIQLHLKINFVTTLAVLSFLLAVAGFVYVLVN